MRHASEKDKHLCKDTDERTEVGKLDLKASQHCGFFIHRDGSAFQFYFTTFFQNDDDVDDDCGKVFLGWVI